MVSEPDNCFALFYFVNNAYISHVVITLIRYFLIPKSRDLVSHNPAISGLKNGPGSRDPGIRDPGIAIPSWHLQLHYRVIVYFVCNFRITNNSCSILSETEILVTTAWV